MMPIWKYRSIEEMPEAWVTNRHKPLGRRIRAVLSLGRLAPPLEIPRGVTKFRSFEELATDRARYESARIDRIRAARARKP
jgi:hypothetical protein